MSSRPARSPRPRTWRRPLVLCALLLSVSACQLTGEPPLRSAPAPTDGTSDAPLGNPHEQFPRTLSGLREFGRRVAITWQDDPRLADATVGLDPAGAWTDVRLTYIAADAERLLVVQADPRSSSQERPSLAGLELLPVPQGGIDALPPFPEAALEPVALGEAAAAALQQCDLPASLTGVIYGTGAPAAWDGSHWTELPVWRATVLTAAGGVLVEPTSGTPYAPLVCVPPPSAAPSE